jgi:AraC-like DNA-binding protein
VRCPGGHRHFDEPEEKHDHMLVAARRGAFFRRVQGRDVLVDGSVAYLSAPGSVEQFAHPVGGDICTAIWLLVRRAQAEMLADPAAGLVTLGHRVGCSPHHLSRVFSRLTGSSATAYRNRLRVSQALERIASGEPDLAVLAAELGFADHAHMARTIRAATGRTRVLAGHCSRPVVSHRHQSAGTAAG